MKGKSLSSVEIIKFSQDLITASGIILLILSKTRKGKKKTQKNNKFQGDKEIQS